MPRHQIVFDDTFFDSLSEQVDAERDGHGRPSFTDVLAYEVMPLLELLAEDYDSVTMPVPDDDLFRILMQPGLLVRHINLYAYELDGRGPRLSHRSRALPVATPRRRIGRTGERLLLDPFSGLDEPVDGIGSCGGHRSTQFTSRDLVLSSEGSFQTAGLGSLNPAVTTGSSAAASSHARAWSPERAALVISTNAGVQM